MRRRYIVVEVDETTGDDVVAISAEHHQILSRVPDLLGFHFGGNPMIVGFVTEIRQGDEDWRPLSIGEGGPRHALRALEVVGADLALPDADPETAWKRIWSDPRTSLWLTLGRGLVGEARWDVRIMRGCGLLQAVAAEVGSNESPLIDERGQVLLRHDGAPAKRNDLRTQIYLLLRAFLDRAGLPDSPFLTHPTRTLWDEVGVWVDVRNTVAHEGAWTAQDRPRHSSSAQKRIVEGFTIAARGDPLESGWIRYDTAVSAAVDFVLRGAVLGYAD